MKARVTSIIVTYGNRSGLASRALSAALAAGASQVVLVLNGSGAENASMVMNGLNEEQRSRTQIELLQTNTGSAGGFGAGIKAALADASTDFVWLLDDDNEPAPDSLNSALRAVQLGGGPPMAAAVCYRPYLEPQRAIAHGASPADTYAAPGSACAFDVRVRLRRRYAPADPTPTRVEVPMAPYGGLLLHRTTIEKIGLPRADYYLYTDDYEFTARLPEIGVRIFLCLDAVIADLESPTRTNLTERGIVRRLRTPPDLQWRLYYQLRNDLHFDRMRARRPRDKFWFVLNLMAYSGLLMTYGSRSKLNRVAMRTIARAIRDGLTGQLGEKWTVGSPGLVA